MDFIEYYKSAWFHYVDAIINTGDTKFNIINIEYKKSAVLTLRIR